MTEDAPIAFTVAEIRSYLPGGWVLADGPEPGSWDARRGRWTTQVQDTADQVWELAVSAREARRKGRIPALREALDRLVREALG